MEILVTFPDEPQAKNSLIVNKKVGSGKFSVYQVHSPAHKENFAMKVFPKNKTGTTQYLKEKLMFKLSHPNIIERIPVSCHKNNFYALLTKFAKHGDFFELVTKDILNKEIFVRSYFRQLIEGIEYIHSQGIAHLDLKLDNLMLGEDFKLKIIDFDQAQLLTDGLISSGGSEGYRAPEVIKGTCKNLAAADVFSAGIILYAFKAKEFPFVEAYDPECRDSRCYSTFVKNNDHFWQKKAEQKQNKSFFSVNFIELINSMLHPRPSKRCTIAEIKGSKWYQGPVVDEETLASEMLESLKILRKLKKKQMSLDHLPKIQIRN